jgi:hypothetical protein
MLLHSNKNSFDEILGLGFDLHLPH